MQQVAEKDVSKVVKVYSGQANKCMCGCKGKWTYNTDSQRSVKIIANKVFNNPEAHYDAIANCYYVNVGGRTLAAYFEA